MRGRDMASTEKKHYTVNVHVAEVTRTVQTGLAGGPTADRQVEDVLTATLRGKNLAEALRSAIKHLEIELEDIGEEPSPVRPERGSYA